MCNIVLDFCPMKKFAISNGIINKLSNLCVSEHPVLRLNSTWALKNLIYVASTEIKQTVIDSLSFETLWSLLDDEIEIQVQSLTFLRNITYRDASLVFQHIETDKLLQMIEKKLSSTYLEIIRQTLFVICNISANENYKNIIMSTKILTLIKDLLIHEDEQIRSTGVWCVINLTWVTDEGVKERANTLNDMGFIEIIKNMTDDSNKQVSQRAETCYNNYKNIINNTK
eukprot:TRINITY_DN3091_c0_g1_i2.p1 TRINITY_DN3091_c0_g1~~TRINITY_DN3091_c0_g1_i2.p1  ORF type:complete len:227 (+),score=44.20 TRINITY_DN3091_c0_g1_i2:189-869(+)